jgi:hypothetical protein
MYYYISFEGPRENPYAVEFTTDKNSDLKSSSSRNRALMKELFNYSKTRAAIYWRKVSY